MDISSWALSQGAEVDVANAIAMSDMFKRAARARLVATLNAQSLKAERGVSVRQLMDVLLRLIPQDLEQQVPSILIVFTHVHPRDTIEDALDEVLTDMISLRKGCHDSDYAKVHAQVPH